MGPRLLQYRLLQSHREINTRLRPVTSPLPYVFAKYMAFRERLVVLALYGCFLPLEPLGWIYMVVLGVLSRLRTVSRLKAQHPCEKSVANDNTENFEMV